MQPRRLALIFLAVAAIGIWAPLLYSSLDDQETLEVATQLLLLVGLAIGARVLFTILRQQRAALRQARERAELLARKDPLTALGNRRAFEEALEAELARAERNESPVSVILGDLDNFKQLNDEHGHGAGDECLRRVAETLEYTARTGDGCYRWGGDEFVVLLPDTSAEEAERVKERICAAAADACRGPSGEPIRLTCGSAEHERGQRANALIQAADDALRRSKQSRRFETLDQA